LWIGNISSSDLGLRGLYYFILPRLRNLGALIPLSYGRRDQVLKKKLAVLLAAAMMVVATMAASPAFAQGNSESAPNCEQGQGRAFDAQIQNQSSNDKPFKHLGKFALCVFR
jgi:hypothetical protein